MNRNAVPFLHHRGNGRQILNTNPNELMVIGTLEDGGLLSIQIEGGQKHRTGYTST